jgi:hypothetical protein
MTGLKQQRVYQRTLFLIGLVLSLYFLLGYQRLSRRVAALDAPLTNAWQKLLATELENGVVDPRNLSRIAENLRQVERSVALLESTAQKVASRIELDGTIRAKLKEPFQLIDFQNERQLRIEELSRLAKQQQVVLEPAVLAGFPESTADRKQPELLWVQLAMINKLLSAAIACKAMNVKSILLPPVEPHQSQSDGREFLDEIPVRIELTGSMEAMSRYLFCLPLRAEELKPLGLPENFPSKPVLFIDKLLVRKQSPEKPDEVSVDLRVCGFVYRDEPAESIN